MQDHGPIARAFAAWQRAYQKLSDAEARLAAATDAWQQGRQPRPDALYDEVLSLKAEQQLRYDIASETLRDRRSTGAAPHAALPSLRAHPAA